MPPNVVHLELKMSPIGFSLVKGNPWFRTSDDFSNDCFLDTHARTDGRTDRRSRVQDRIPAGHTTKAPARGAFANTTGSVGHGYNETRNHTSIDGDLRPYLRSRGCAI